MKRTSGLAGLGIDGGSEGRSSSDHEYASSSASYDNSAPRDSRVSLGNGFSRSSTPLSHLRQPSLTTACLPASSPDLSKRSFGARMFGAFDSQDTHPESSKQGASSSAPGTSRRTPRSLPIRLLQLGYVTFALVYTTGSLLGWTGHDYSAQALIPRQAAQQLPLSAMGDAWQAVRDRVSPPQSTSLPDAVDLEVKVVEEKEKDDIESIELPIPASGRVTRGWQSKP